MIIKTHIFKKLYYKNMSSKCVGLCFRSSAVFDVSYLTSNHSGCLLFWSLINTKIAKQIYGWLLD